MYNTNDDGLNTKQIQKETNYNITSENIDIYSEDYSFPIKSGTKFPDDKLTARANLVYTNTLLYNNRYDKVFGTYLNNFSIADINMYDTQIRDICASLPYFKKTVNSYISLITGNKPIIDIDSSNLGNMYESIIDKCNIVKIMNDIIKSDFLQPCSLYIVEKNKKGLDVVREVPCKNFVIYVDPEDITTVYSYLTFSITGNIIEFIEYINDGTIYKRVFKYNDGVVGSEIKDAYEESKAFNGKFNEAPCILFSNNVDRLGDIYGNDRLSTFDSAVLAVIRSFNQIIRLCERLKEEIRVVPESALQVLPTGQYVYLNKGVVTYKDNCGTDTRNDVKIITIELKDNIEAAILAFDKAVATLASASSLSKIFYDFEFAGSRTLSGEALKTMLLPTTMEAKHIISDKMDGMKELIHKILLLNDVDIDLSEISIDFNEGIPESLSNKVEYVNSRLENGTFNKVDAIKYLDGVSTNKAISSIIAMNKLNKLLDSPVLDKLLEQVDDETEENNEEQANNEDIAFDINKDDTIVDSDTDEPVFLSPQELPFGGIDIKG
jgi:hypothetical protein